jgi:hypothetical protein
MDQLKTQKEALLWKQAKKRVGFKNHLYTYLVINGFLWLMWLVKGASIEKEYNIPGPLFCSLGWGFGLFWHYMSAYVFVGKIDSVEKEFEKLKAKS